MNFFRLNHFHLNWVLASLNTFQVFDKPIHILPRTTRLWRPLHLYAESAEGVQLGRKSRNLPPPLPWKWKPFRSCSNLSRSIFFIHAMQKNPYQDRWTEQFPFTWNLGLQDIFLAKGKQALKSPLLHHIFRPENRKIHLFWLHRDNQAQLRGNKYAEREWRFSVFSWVSNFDYWHF